MSSKEPLKITDLVKCTNCGGETHQYDGPRGPHAGFTICIDCGKFLWVPKKQWDRLMIKIERQKLSDEIRLVHNGAIVARAKEELECNGFCTSDIHCDLYYTEKDELDVYLSIDRWQRFVSGVGLAIKIIRIEPAMEAPPENSNYYHYGIKTKDMENVAILVFWRPDEPLASLEKIAFLAEKTESKT